MTSWHHCIMYSVYNIAKLIQCCVEYFISQSKHCLLQQRILGIRCSDKSTIHLLGVSSVDVCHILFFPEIQIPSNRCDIIGESYRVNVWACNLTLRQILRKIGWSHHCHYFETLQTKNYVKMFCIK